MRYMLNPNLKLNLIFNKKQVWALKCDINPCGDLSFVATWEKSPCSVTVLTDYYTHTNTHILLFWWLLMINRGYAQRVNIHLSH